MPKGLGQYDRVEREHVGGSDSVDTSDPGANGMSSGRTFNERMEGVSSSQEGRVPSPMAGQPAKWWWDTQPGIGRNWLPEGLFPEIDELREEQLARMDERSDALDKRSQVVAGFEAEDAARNAALYAGDNAPAVTGTSEREDALREADAEVLAATRRLHDFYLRAEAKIKEMYPKWQLEFARARAERADEVAQARAALEAAEQGASDVEQAEVWVQRTVKPKGGRHMAAPALSVGFMNDTGAAHA